jgi:hypothetical protein
MAPKTNNNKSKPRYIHKRRQELKKFIREEHEIVQQSYYDLLKEYTIDVIITREHGRILNCIDTRVYIWEPYDKYDMQLN